MLELRLKWYHFLKWISSQKWLIERFDIEYHVKGNVPEGDIQDKNRIENRGWDKK
ncbi:hypothetical protein VPHG_00020 [Vibrio phage 11895-B1]|uniref:hypothetical protein n=1 Tax=Vibrio phage 11895-B1 TaxID=754075 RepID=UPI0002C0F9A7|nr:hypothetical protein VPHG_00020 [Vibrio phage 11895-B1]AGH32087.1 hypothetical protein VPHG_00020 [Vibrio phage 11895-B1]